MTVENENIIKREFSSQEHQLRGQRGERQLRPSRQPVRRGRRSHPRRPEVKSRRHQVQGYPRKLSKHPKGVKNEKNNFTFKSVYSGGGGVKQCRF